MDSSPGMTNPEKLMNNVMQQIDAIFDKVSLLCVPTNVSNDIAATTDARCSILLSNNDVKTGDDKAVVDDIDAVKVDILEWNGNISVRT
mmetsp:Transcript_26205/g.30442  ORF Transcript_26205/g.30442 Transcript_26205/m.30442 type:complete len:89 (-) Transcript_26205:153-419(-)